MRNFKVAIQGIQASFHDIAAQKYYGSEVEVVECSSFKQTCEKLASNEVDYVVMAIENSIAGSILTNYTLIKDHNFRIIGEQYLKIELHLLALPGVMMEDIDIIQSHPMAIAQCNTFLGENPSVKVFEQADTAACARQIKEGGLRNTAAIANTAAAKKFGLSVLKSNIESYGANSTRFLILSKGDSKPENPNKASICFTLNDQVGCLADVLGTLKKSNINISKIQSLPIPEVPTKYEFYADLEWSETGNYIKAIEHAIKGTENLQVLGEYIKGNL